LLVLLYTCKQLPVNTGCGRRELQQINGSGGAAVEGKRLPRAAHQKAASDSVKEEALLEQKVHTQNGKGDLSSKKYPAVGVAAETQLQPLFTPTAN
jgi:hypothetical protein